jgi:hypothetical protein
MVILAWVLQTNILIKPTSLSALLYRHEAFAITLLPLRPFLICALAEY